MWKGLTEYWPQFGNWKISGEAISAYPSSTELLQRFNIRNLAIQNLRNRTWPVSQISLQVWESCMVVWTSGGHGKILKIIHTFQPLLVYITMS